MNYGNREYDPFRDRLCFVENEDKRTKVSFKYMTKGSPDFMARLFNLLCVEYNLPLRKVYKSEITTECGVCVWMDDDHLGIMDGYDYVLGDTYNNIVSDIIMISEKQQQDFIEENDELIGNGTYILKGSDIERFAANAVNLIIETLGDKVTIHKIHSQDNGDSIIIVVRIKGFKSVILVHLTRLDDGTTRLATSVDVTNKDTFFTTARKANIIYKINRTLQTLDTYR